MARKECTLYEYMGGAHMPVVAWIEDGKIYSLTRETCDYREGNPYFSEDGEFYSPETQELKGYRDPATVLLPFEVNGKWGYGNPFTHEIPIPAVFSFAWKFENDFAVVCQGGRKANVESTLERGHAIRRKHGVIDAQGKLIIPLEYDKIVPLMAWEVSYFIAKKQGKFGVLTACGDTAIPFIWDGLEIMYDHETEPLLRCMVNTPGDSKARIPHYGIYDAKLRLIVPAELTHEPIFYPVNGNYAPEAEFREEYEQNLGADYFLLGKESKYGILCTNGKLTCEIESDALHAAATIFALGGRFG